MRVADFIGSFVAYQTFLIEAVNEILKADA